MAPDEARPAAGRTVGAGTVLAGRFTLEDLLDETGGAKFWRATDATLARSVAVHVISADDPRADELLDAARRAATVADGHLLRVLDAARESDIVYVVVEWGSGISLDRMLGEGPVPPRRAAWLVKEVAEAITSAHRQGIAHGRLVPENVMVNEAGAVKIIGFVTEAALRPSGDRTVSGDRPNGPLQADVVNLAGLLYAALVGRWPGIGTSSVPEAPVVHGRTLRPRQVRPGVPRPLDALCDRVLNPSSHPHSPPIGTAHEIYAVLSDYGTELAGAPEATTLFTSQERVAGLASEDPEATQIGTPVFDDEPIWPPAGEAEVVPPPPDLPEPEQRPLFAPDPPEGAPRRTPTRRPVASRPTRSVGPGNGRVPESWGPDSDGVPEEETGEWGTGTWAAEDNGNGWLRLAGVVALIVVILLGVVLAFNLGKDHKTPPVTAASSAPSSPSPVATPTALTISGVTDFDPDGDPPTENPGEAHLAIDGDPTTAWNTVTYKNHPTLGNLKPGVGLLVDLGSAQRLGRVQLRLIGSPTSLQILTAPGASTAPTTEQGLTVSASAQGAGTNVDLTFDKAVTTRYFVVWLTSLPPFGHGYRGQIAEINAWS